MSTLDYKGCAMFNCPIVNNPSSSEQSRRTVVVHPLDKLPHLASLQIPMACTASKGGRDRVLLLTCFLVYLALAAAGRTELPSGVYRPADTDDTLATESSQQNIAVGVPRVIRSPTIKSPLVARLLEEREEGEASDASSALSYAAPEQHGHNVQLEHSYQQYNIQTDVPGHPEEGKEHEGETADPQYKYVYEVQGEKGSGDFGHAEMRDGGKTWGRYFVHQPDGRVKTVRYWADKTGYHADVGYHGEAVSHEAPEYGAAPEHE